MILVMDDNKQELNKGFIYNEQSNILLNYSFFQDVQNYHQVASDNHVFYAISICCYN
jgi:hypothetical protein